MESKPEVKVECVKGDISNQPDITAIVNAANAQLKRGGGVAGAIHKAAGPELEKECRNLAPIKPGEAVITSAFELPNDYVIHCLGPVYGVDKPEEKLLAECYYRSLELAEKHRVDSIAFPAISTGAFGFPIEKATRIAFNSIKELVPNLKHVKLIRFVLYSEKDLEAYEKEKKRLQKP